MNTCLSILLAVSTHLGLDADYNSIHPHVRCTVDNWITGAYYNSEKNISYYVGKKISKNDTGIPKNRG